MRCWVQRVILISRSSRSSRSKRQKLNLLLLQLVLHSLCLKSSSSSKLRLELFNKTRVTFTLLHHFSIALPLLILIRNRSLVLKRLIQYLMMISSQLYLIHKNRTILLVIFRVLRSRRCNKISQLLQLVKKGVKMNKHVKIWWKREKI